MRKQRERERERERERVREREKEREEESQQFTPIHTRVAETCKQVLVYCHMPFVSHLL